MRKKVNNQSFNNAWFNKGGSVVKVALWYLTNTLFFKNPLNPFSKIKVLLLRLFGAKVGENVFIKPSVNIKYPWRLVVGSHTWIGENVWIDNLSEVKIGAHCCLSQGAMLLTGNHNYKKTSFDLIVGEITLEDGVWIGAQAIVTAGVTCRSHSILTVKSVATKDLGEYTINQGNPAINVKERIIE